MFQEDLAEYTCKATNSIGTKTSSAHVNTNYCNYKNLIYIKYKTHKDVGE